MSISDKIKRDKEQAQIAGEFYSSGHEPGLSKKLEKALGEMKYEKTKKDQNKTYSIQSDRERI